jgi:hypothetical protein
MIGAVPFVRLADRARRASEGYTVFAVTLQDIEKALASKVTIDPREKLPKEYYEFLDVFSKKEADKLPPPTARTTTRYSSRSRTTIRTHVRHVKGEAASLARVLGRDDCR